MCKPVAEFHKFDSVEKHELEAAKWKSCEEESQGFHDEDMEIAKDVWKTKEEVEQLAIEILAARGMLNDGLYAEIFSQSRWLSRSWGPKRIKQALLRKGVNEAIVNKATKDVFEDANVTKNEESSNVRLSKLSMDQLFAQAAKQWQRSQGKSPEARKSRMLRWLQYRGFDWGVTLTILKKLESEYPP
ncbi:hypothetical protein QJS10_CPA08g01853 [Acorus calamus]|uniref:Regulatory protein RecX n=1 Tax=Acorus calamus TaxID=4465 RepID=A0AAV9ED53_ACOCL|nr:hypothetical protein QJS10_CPA08g01853 [Acorus calamus]